MSTDTINTVEHQDEIPVYRAISRAAVVSFVLALLSSVGMLSAPLLILCVAGVFFGVTALKNIRRYPDELTGRGLAKFGVIFSLFILVSGSTVHAIIYATEVPEGYQRISFSVLQPSDDAPDSPIPPISSQLDGQRVFIKGYVYPDGQRYDIKRFVMVPDMGTCCFGGQPKPTDMIEVTLKNPLRTEYSRRRRKVGGVFKLNPMPKTSGKLVGVYYRLEADYLQ